MTANAGVYRVTFEQVSAEDVHIVSPTGVHWGYNYNTQFNMRGGGGVSKEPAPGSPVGTGAVDCYGTIKVKFTWFTITNEPPPSCAILVETSWAQWHGTSGHVSNGLGHIEVGDAQGGISQGTKITVKYSPGAFFTKNIVPIASSVNTNAGDILGASASVNYQADLFPVTVDVAGTTLGSILIGQRAKASLTCDAPVTFSNHSWSVTGNIFDSFFVTADENNGHAVPANLNATTPTWCWTQKENSVQDVYGQAMAYNGFIQIGFVHATRRVQVDRPVNEYLLTANHETTYETFSDQFRSKFGNWQVTPHIHGCDFNGQVQTPQPYSTYLGLGEWTFVQLVNDDVLLEGGGIWDYHLQTVGYELDTFWPYPFIDGVNWRPCDSIEGETNDSPSQSIRGGTHFSRSFYADMYSLYKPPATWLGSEIVPLMKGHWVAFADVSRTSNSVPWPSVSGMYVPGAVIQGFGTQLEEAHPIWTHKSVH